MNLVRVDDKTKIERFLRPQTPLHLYALGDLDDFFWPYTTWYALEENSLIQELVLLYQAGELATLLALSATPNKFMPQLLKAIMPLLPQHFHAHFSGDLASALTERYRVESFGVHHKMQLTQPARLEQVNISEVRLLSSDDLAAIHALYTASYPGNWFDARMLETGFYYGIWRGNMLVSIAGVHVYSPKYKVAVLGNITTHPQHRGQGFAAAVAASLCLALQSTVDYIGLNVKADNSSALACYRRIGFERIAAYEECNLTDYEVWEQRA